MRTGLHDAVSEEAWGESPVFDDAMAHISKHQQSRHDSSPASAREKQVEPLVEWKREADSFAVADRRVPALDPTEFGRATHGGSHFAVGGAVGESSSMYSSSGDPQSCMNHDKLDYEGTSGKD
ncbi:hypothetical protein BJ170DRAFT_683684 [Xylariales sp. AK1849]|nr:hypothetical protein BJ170DRAFT_683684 [Xylariales sp. AK1849]